MLTGCQHAGLLPLAVTVLKTTVCRIIRAHASH